MIRVAERSDLEQIMELGKSFGHQMLYQKDRDLMERYLNRIVVSENSLGVIVGFYHWIQSNDLGFAEMLRCYRQMPESVIQRALSHESKKAPWASPICVCMQGGSHREVFRDFILYFQQRFTEIWCYCSAKSARPGTYKDLGFVFRDDERFSFFNIHKGDASTYCLGTWRKSDAKVTDSLA